LVSVAAFSNPVKATSEKLAPFNNRGFVGMVCSELGHHIELINSIIKQFRVILMYGGAL